MKVYIVRKVAPFGTLYLDTSHYNINKSTTKNINEAFFFGTLTEAEKSAKWFKGEVVEYDTENNLPLVYCQNCIYFNGQTCRRIGLAVDDLDFCSRGVTK